VERVVGEAVGERGLDGKVIPVMATMPAGRAGSIVAIMVFPRESEASAIAQLKKSMLGARLATVAGVKADGLKGR
jgi:hypothetical protein